LTSEDGQQRSLLNMDRGEVVSRRAAWEEVQEAGRQLLDELLMEPNPDQLSLLDSAAGRALIDAQKTNQSQPLTRTVVIE